MDGLIRELEERHESARQILGDEHPLTQFIRNALESGDPQLLQVAKSACDGGHQMLHPWTNLREPTREELLEEYARKPVRCFLQVDGWEDNHGGNTVVHPDEEGHVLTSGMRYELRKTNYPMRVQIYEGSDKEAVLTLLNKAHTWIERGWERLTTPSSPQTPDKQRTQEERTVLSEQQPREEVRTVRWEEQSREEQRPVPFEQQPREEDRTLRDDRPSLPPSMGRASMDGETEYPGELAGSLSSSVGDSQAQALLERVFVLNVDMVKLEPEEVARVASDQQKYFEAYIEVADQGIEWFTKFRNALVSMR
jgi:hypothetical protein